MKVQRINLIPERLIAKQGPNKDHVLLAGFCSVVALLVILGGVQLFQLSAVNKQQQSLQVENSQIQKKISAIQIATAHQEVSQARAKAITKALQQRIVWSKILREISLVTPEPIWLNKFSFGNNKSARSLIVSGESPSPAAISKYFRILENSLFFQKVQLNYTEKLARISPDLYRFEFEIIIDETSMEMAGEI